MTPTKEQRIDLPQPQRISFFSIKKNLWIFLVKYVVCHVRILKSFEKEAEQRSL